VITIGPCHATRQTLDRIAKADAKLASYATVMADHANRGSLRGLTQFPTLCDLDHHRNSPTRNRFNEFALHNAR
jgi:hypothetical protein